ncbi:cytidylate kinase family protein [Ruminococcus sp. zg-924]|uniref:cytidylate kinase family protein n=1 Tax=Ruminococcus sp. zg-924 TaxID=2678505 RepID=UPI00210C7168|nr:cytidylate kinase family protein [Ruminococcus sp. zg-924]
MFITINGHLGSGKSTVCALIKEQYDFEVFNTGSIQRKIANQMQISTLELNKKSKEDFSVDNLIDNTIVEFATEHNGENIIFDSRLAWHFVPKSFKVRLTIDPATAAQRVFNNRKSQEESYLSVEEALDKLADRQQIEAERYKMIYNLDINDENNYDLIVDTSYLSPQEVADIIIDKHKQWIKTP